MAENVLTILKHTVFDILLPTSDILGDFTFSIKAFSSGNPVIGFLMIFPVMLNILFNLYKWYYTYHDTQKEKRFTWVLVMLNLWPQYQVLKLLLLIFRGKSKDIWKPLERKIKNEISYIEPLIEAIPQFFASMCVFSMLAVKHLCIDDTLEEALEALEEDETYDLKFETCTDRIQTLVNQTEGVSVNLFAAIVVDVFSGNGTEVTKVFGEETFGIRSTIVFPLSILISLLSGIKTLVSYLQDGSLKMISNTKCGNYVVSISMVVYILTSFFEKFYISILISYWVGSFDGIFAFLVIFLIWIIFPTLIYIPPLARVVGVKKYAGLVLEHPELLVLPLITEYVIGPIEGGNHYPSCCRCCKFWRCCTWSCCCKRCDVIHTDNVVISNEMSCTKMLYVAVYSLCFVAKEILVISDPDYSNTAKIESVVIIIIILLGKVCFGITLICGKSKGVLVIGNVRAKEEVELKLQNIPNLQV